MLSHLPELLATGVDSLKIEGRMRSLHYVATITRLYREALDHIRQRWQKGEQPEQELLQQLAEAAATIGNRDFTTGNYLDRAGQESISRNGAVKKPGVRFIGRWLAACGNQSWFRIAAPFDLQSTTEQLECITVEPAAAESEETVSRRQQTSAVATATITGPVGEKLSRLQPNSVVRLTGTFNTTVILQARSRSLPFEGTVR